MSDQTGTTDSFKKRLAIGADVISYGRQSPDSSDNYSAHTNGFVLRSNVKKISANNATALFVDILIVYGITMN